MTVRVHHAASTPNEHRARNLTHAAVRAPHVGSRGVGRGLPLLGPRPVGGAGPNAVVARAELGLAILPVRRAYRVIDPVAGQRRLYHGDPRHQLARSGGRRARSVAEPGHRARAIRSATSGASRRVTWMYRLVTDRTACPGALGQRGYRPLVRGAGWRRHARRRSDVSSTPALTQLLSTALGRPGARADSRAGSGRLVCARPGRFDQTLVTASPME